ncbi:phosphoenolpyruvate--protein phosphotransferase [Puniceibacterium sediminis]|uniref:Phosphocarrier protein HPr /phosphoenolpyruvate--protein phosphotransferase /dihydroxyacetone kinase DhaM subunit n=1 Tax=Puniceibacterium sediminis TaxID=1608407 RepID=A0A238YV31_9RHOB|nr:phosphoenolpyruvate--protein phosphotransferase [Puniceibacterium sediminis]SNR74802.1 Phosphocarrier protein HPr /phosphoenolpyruvate--protein phosphotransferase /dihydroxyacetone kinase DhaM subunit [Puniceibacterium sediminis]
MIGIVIVSHSRKLSDGLKDVADAMTQVPIPIASAGGVDDPDHPLGTDGIRVLDAIRDVMSDDGVLVFADIGSAKLNAEMAMDLLEPEEQTKVQFCDAPLVEGVLAAAVQIAAGSSLEDAMREARQAVPAPTEAVKQQQDTAQTGGVSREFTIRNPLGLHARPAASLVSAMNAFSGDIRLRNVTKGKTSVNAKSINGVMLSEVARNDRILMVADPAEAEAVFAAIDQLIQENFGEDGIAPVKPEPIRKPVPQPRPPRDVSAGTLTGLSIARGFALGPIRHVRSALPEVEPVSISDPDAEIERFKMALSAAETEINGALSAAGERISAYDRKIFDAHISYLHDPDIIETVLGRISKQHICAEAIWRQVVWDLSRTYAALQDPLLQARAGDVIDVGLRVLRLLMGQGDATDHAAEPSILAYEELRPSDVLTLNQETVLGICAATGGTTSHAAILASALNIPVVFALGDALAAVADGQQVLLDGAAAKITIAPDASAIETMQNERKIWQDHVARAEAVRDLPAETLDGHKVRVAANMASVDELGVIMRSGAQEVGLLRTEFLYMRRDTAPGEDEQYDIYRSIVAGLKGKPLTVRTADIGGDKPVSYLDRPAEANPNLGWRGLRYSLAVPELFETQLAAILRASAHGPVRIMFPLVSTVDEVKAAKQRVQSVMDQLRTRALPFDEGLEIGIMIEVPAAAEMADLIAPEVDFFSIGTNDLTQYVMAADRANPKLKDLFDPFNPAVLRMIAKSIKAAHDADIWIGMCGAMAGSPIAAPILLGLGLDEFSMTPADIAEFKLTLRGLSLSECRNLSARVLGLDTARSVREQASLFLGRHKAMAKTAATP